MASAIGDFFSNIGKGVSEGISNLTGGSGNKNSSSNSSTSSSSSTSSASTNTRPTPGRGNYGSNSTTTNKTSSSSSTNRSDSAGAQALTQQIASNSSTSTTTSGSKGNSKINDFVSTVKENISNSSNTPKTTVTEAMRNNTNTSNNQSGSTTSQKTQNQTSSSVINTITGGSNVMGTIIEDKPAKTVTEAMRENTSEKPSVGGGSTSKADNVVLGGFTGIINSPSESSSLPKPTISAVVDTPTVGTPIIMMGDNKGQALTPDMITPNKPSSGAGSTFKGNDVVLGGLMNGVVNMGGLVGVNPSVGELNKPVSQTSVNTDAMVGLSEKPTLSLLPNDYNPLKVQSTITTLPDGSTWQIGVGNDGKVTTRNMDKTVGIGTDLIYRDPSLVGIHTFDSKAESEAFLKQLYADGNYDWTDTSVPWYDTESGEFIGYLGEEAYPYAVSVPETYDAPIILEFNSGGTKGNSPSTGTGKSSWTDVPSAKTRKQLRDAAGFDYRFSSRNLDYDELVTQNERRGYDSSWYDGMVGQNSTPYDAEKGGYDARTSNISVADVKSGKVDYATLSGVQGGKDILNADKAVGNYIETIETKLTPEESADIYMQSLETGKPRVGLGYVKPDRQNIVDLYTWTDAMEKGAEKRDNKFWFDNSWLISPVVRGLNDIGDKIDEFNADFRQGNVPILDTIVEYAPRTPLVGGLGISVGQQISDAILGKNKTASSDDLFSPQRTTSWLLSMGSGLAHSPMEILSLPENVLGAAEEIGYDKAGKVAASAALGLANTVVTDYQDNPDYAVYDLVSLAIPVGGMIGNIGKVGKMTTKVDGVDIEFGKPDISVDDAVQELRERQQFEKKMAKAEKKVEKQATKEAKSGDRQYSPIYSNLHDAVDDMTVNNIRDYNIRNPSTVANVNAVDFSDEMTGVNLFKDNSLSESVLNLRDRDSTLPILRDRDSALPILRDRDSTLPILRDRDSTLPILRDRDSTLPILRDRDSGNKALVVRDRDGALAVRDRDKQTPYLPKDRDRNVPPVRRKKDKILPFLDELGDLFGGSGDGGLSGGTYWGRGRGRSWRVENEDIADASQFSGLF